MGRDRLGASFRDPCGFVFRHERHPGLVLRQVNVAYQPHYDRLLESGLHAELVDAGLLVPHEEIEPATVDAGAEAYRVLLPEQIDFISYPYEWSFGQLKDAALLTLELQRRALEHGMWLKDASAYNVQFRRGRPVFIDTLSFETHPEGRPWVAYHQFCRHFLAPLALASYRGIELLELLRVHIDGIPLELATRLLPRRSRLRLTLYLNLHLHARAIAKHEAIEHDAGAGSRLELQTGMSRTRMRSLIDGLQTAVRKLQWKPEGTEWGDYYADTSYSEAASRAKMDIVRRFLASVSPRRVWDLGANTGRFSRIAAEADVPTVAFDVDPAAVEKAYQAIRAQGETNLLPLVMDLTNPSPDLGWNFDERMSLRGRGPVDLVMALALIHHLAIGHNVPLEDLARFFARLGRHLIVEFVPKSDSQVQRLLAGREDIFPDYDVEGFEASFEREFEVLDRAAVSDSDRRLYLLRRRAQACSASD